MKLLSHLSRSHPFIFSAASVVIPGVTTTLLLILFSPFGLIELPPGKIWMIALALGSYASLSVWLVVRGLQWGLPDWTKPENWTIGRELTLFALVLLVICLGIWGGLLVGGSSHLSPGTLLPVVVTKTLAASSFPIIILVLFEQFRYQQRKRVQAEQLHQQLSLPPNPPFSEGSASTLLRFVAENGKLELQLSPEEVLFLHSDGNYVEVHYLADGGQPQRKLIRNRLKTFVKLLPDDSFFQCHKRFVVNAQHILSLNGNARQLSLKLRFTETEIPVSRSRYDSLQTFLTPPDQGALPDVPFSSH